MPLLSVCQARFDMKSDLCYCGIKSSRFPSGLPEFVWSLSWFSARGSQHWILISSVAVSVNQPPIEGLKVLLSFSWVLLLVLSTYLAEISVCHCLIFAFLISMADFLHLVSLVLHT